MRFEPVGNVATRHLGDEASQAPRHGPPAPGNGRLSRDGGGDESLAGGAAGVTARDSRSCSDDMLVDAGVRRQAWMQEPVTSRGPSNQGAGASRKGASPLGPPLPRIQSSPSWFCKSCTCRPRHDSVSK